MNNVMNLFADLAPKLEALAKANAAVGPVTEVGGRFAIPLVELSLGLGGGGSGEGADPQSGGSAKGFGGGADGALNATPVAVVIVEDGAVRLEMLGR